MVATGVGADDMVRLAGSTMTGTLNLQGSPPLVIPEGAVSGYVATSDGSGNVSWAPSAGGGGGGSELIMTAVQTSAYSANASDYVRADTTSGSFTVTLPDEPPAGTVVGVKMTGMTAGNVTTVACSGSDVFNVTGGAASFTLRTLNQGAVFQYGAGIWLVTSSDFALSSLDDRYVPVLNIAAFGATTGSSDNGPFINDAIAALPGGHGNIYIPPGTWHYTTQISLSGLSGIRFFGDAQRGNTTSTTLLYDGTGSASAISATGSAAITLERLFIEYSSSSFTGNLIDFSGTGSDSAYETIRDCFVGSAIPGNATGVCLNHCNQSAIEDSHFQGSLVAIQGQSETGSYANGIKIDGCSFNANGTHIMNAAQAWMISNNVFEPCFSNAPGMYAYTSGYSYASGLTFLDNWSGDTTTSSGAQISVQAQGLTIIGNYIGIAAGETGIALTNCDGVNIHGNTITDGAKAIDFGSGGGNAMVRITGNTYGTSFSVAVIAGTIPADAVIELPGLGTGYGIVPAAAGVVQFPDSAISVGGVPITHTLLNEITGTYGPNLLSNPDFSSTADWSTSSPGAGMLASNPPTFTSINTDSQDGSGTCANVVCDGTEFYEGIAQTVTGLAVNTTYAYQCYVKTVSGTNPQGVMLAVYDATNSIHFTNEYILAGSDAAWQPLVVQFTTGATGPVTVYVVIRDDSAAACTFRASNAYLGTYTGYASTSALGAETTRAETAEALALPKAGGTLTGWIAPAVTALTFGSSVAVNAALGNAFSLTLTASTATLASPTSPVDGQIIRVRVTQGSGGSFTLAYGTAYDFGAAGAPALSTAAGKVDVLAFEYVASISKWCFTGGGGLGY